MRVVAARAVLASRRVLPYERSALLGVAAGAQLVERIAGLEHAHVVRPVRRVAGGAVHLAFAHRHVPRLLDLHRLLLVAGLARLDDRRRFQLRLLGLRTVHAVAGRARHVARVVHAALEVRVRALVVAAQTRSVDVTGRHRREAFDFRLVARIDVRLAWTVAALAASVGLAGRSADVLCLAVQGLMQGRRLGFVAGRTGIVADESGRLRRGRRRGSSRPFGGNGRVRRRWRAGARAGRPARSPSPRGLRARSPAGVPENRHCVST
jgi:hypothetical protein